MTARRLFPILLALLVAVTAAAQTAEKPSVKVGAWSIAPGGLSADTGIFWYGRVAGDAAWGRAEAMLLDREDAESLKTLDHEADVEGLGKVRYMARVEVFGVTGKAARPDDVKVLRTFAVRRQNLWIIVRRSTAETVEPETLGGPTPPLPPIERAKARAERLRQVVIGDPASDPAMTLLRALAAERIVLDQARIVRQMPVLEVSLNGAPFAALKDEAAPKLSALWRVPAKPGDTAAFRVRIQVEEYRVTTQGFEPVQGQGRPGLALSFAGRAATTDARGEALIEGITFGATPIELTFEPWRRNEQFKGQVQLK